LFDDDLATGRRAGRYDRDTARRTFDDRTAQLRSPRRSNNDIGRPVELGCVAGEWDEAKAIGETMVADEPVCFLLIVTGEIK
jgi:hypothetical protein